MHLFTQLEQFSSENMTDRKYEPLENLVSDFRSGAKQGVTALTFLAVTALAQQGKSYFDLNEVYNYIQNNLLKKLSSKPTFLREFSIISLAPTLGKLCDMGVLEKIGDNPARYRTKLPLSVLQRYAGEIYNELLNYI